MLKSVIALILTFSLSLWASGRVLNFSETNRVNDILITKDYLLGFTGGGLYTHNLKTSENHTEYGSTYFPDPDLTAACIDEEGTIWVGSANGYLSTWDPEKMQWGELIHSYQASGWKITTMIPYKHYIIVGSSKGVSLFDKKEKRAKKNAVSFTNLTTTQVNALAIYRDRLYVGLENGVVYLDSISTKLQIYNFFNPDIWKIDSTRSGVTKSFLVINDSLYSFNQSAIVYNGMLVQTKDKNLVFDDNVLLETPSTISCLKTSGSDCWVGTVKDHIYKMNNSGKVQFKANGPTFHTVNALAAGNNGHVFVVPDGPLDGNDWWRGFQEFTGNSWIIHNRSLYPDMGPMPGNPDTRAIIRSREGDIWISTSGAHCKRFILQNNNWAQYCTYSKGGSNGLSYCGPVCPPEPWAKTDAVGQDSSGFVWAGCWKNPDGLLVCFDPANKPDPNVHGTTQEHYRRFFESGNQYNAEDVSFVNVDIFGTIFIGRSNPSDLLIIKHNGNPIRDGINVVSVLNEPGEITDAVSAPTGKSYFLGTNGLFEYDPKTLALQKMENVSTGITALEIEDENILWYSSINDGLVRYDLSDKVRLTTYDKVDGLVSTSISDLSLDRENGIMWIATDQGVSRLSIGIKSQQATKEQVKVFPIPFKKQKNKVINFYYVSPRAEIAVYSMHGSIVGKPVLRLRNSFQAQFSWTVPESVSPGTYYYVVKNDEYSVSGKLLITP
jgi:sugar lactone lactonase YvrE